MHNPVTVYVWDTRGNAFKDLDNFSINDHGHASMQIGYEYLSFWPKNRGGKLANIATAFFLRDAKYIDSYSEDRIAMGRGADHKVTLTSINNKIALDYWDDVKMMRTGFRLMETNCSTIVGRSLVKACDKNLLGIANLLSTSPTLIMAELFFWEPQKVLEPVQGLS